MTDGRGVASPTSLRFSTATLPERQRLTLYREIFGRGVVNMDITPLSDDSWAEAELRALPGASFMWGSNSAYRFEKVRERALDCDDILLVWAVGPTRGVFRHLGKEMRVEDGATILMSCEHHAVAENVAPIRHVNVKIQRALLTPIVGEIGDALMRPIRPDCAAMRLLKGYVETIRELATETAVDRAVVVHICDLIALSAGVGRDAAEQARGRGLRVARHDAICKLILADLGNPNLSVNHVAQAQGITPRYVQLLFEQEGTTFSAFVLEQRLALVRRRLLSPLFDHQPIGALALEAGFGDLSYFNRAFRRAYGETPSDVRHRALRVTAQ
jgi:AraC-like DNA-binding protein